MKQYQFTTCAPLASSKSYLNDKKECSAMLSTVAKVTNEWRKKRELPPLTARGLLKGSRMVQLDFCEEVMAKSVMGEPKPISTRNLDEDLRLLKEGA
jgi:hypothetical protein